MTKKKRSMFQIAWSIGITTVIVLASVLFSRNDTEQEKEVSRSDLRSTEELMAFSHEADHYYAVAMERLREGLEIPTEESVNLAQERLGGELVPPSQSKNYEGYVTNLQAGDKIELTINAPVGGLYEVWLDYRVEEQTFLNPELSFEINDTTQFNEMNALTLPLQWQQAHEESAIQFDRYGDQLQVRSELAGEWDQQPLKDPNHFFADPLKFELAEGENTLSFELIEGAILLGDIIIKNTQRSTLSYEEYLVVHEGASKQNDQQLLTIETENPVTKSRRSIRGQYLRNPALSPYDYQTRLLNVLDGASFSEPGDQVSYVLTVEESGFYQITFKYLQNMNNGMPARRRIELNGEVPFEELSTYSFDYSNKWIHETLSDDEGNAFLFYLEEGQHTLSLVIDSTLVAAPYHELLALLAKMDGIGAEVVRLTGGLVDRQRDWRIETYFPELKTSLAEILDGLNAQREVLIDLLGNEKLPILTELAVAIAMVESFYEQPDTLPHYLTRFNQGYSSAYGRIQSVLPTLIASPLSMDRIFIHDANVELPRERVGIFTTALESVKAFAYTFINPRYRQINETEGEAIEVWVNQSRLNLEIIQRLVDEEFTPKTGIQVNLSLLPDEQRIILNNAAGSVPDAALSVSHGMPFELGLRGIIEDLSELEGFEQLTAEYNPNSFTQYIYDEGVYAIPETQTVKLLYYRKDLLEMIGEEPPQTWEEMISIIPLLQRYDMNIYIPLGSDSSHKGFDTTTPFIYQYGGRLFDDTGSQTEIHLGGSYEAFDFMTSLFTVYNMPLTTAQFYQSFRDGKTPIGIGDANLYVQLKHAAPEIAGQWGMIPIPGIENDSGEIERWDPTYGSASIIFSDSEKKAESWSFLQWWNSSQTQATFSYDLQATLGHQFLYLPANLEGFKASAWPQESKQVILEQWQWIQTTGRVPGDYIVERELSNAWNKVVLDGENPRIAIDHAVRIIDKELERKLREFGYIQEDVLVRPFNVPVLETIERWIPSHDGDN